MSSGNACTLHALQSREEEVAARRIPCGESAKHLSVGHRQSEPRSVRGWGPWGPQPPTRMTVYYGWIRDVGKLRRKAVSVRPQPREPCLSGLALSAVLPGDFPQS